MTISMEWLAQFSEVEGEAILEAFRHHGYAVRFNWIWDWYEIKP